MAQLSVLLLFLAALAICLVSRCSVLPAILFGVLCFACFALLHGHSLKAVLTMLFSGMWKAANVALILLLIALLTASWRSSGTIPFIICQSLNAIVPSVFFLCVFLLCCFMSLLLGSAFGSASTIGVVLMLLARAANLNLTVTAGAILSGIYFGDRGSPVSSSANLVCSITGTAIYDNFYPMLRSAGPAFCITCLAYLALSLGSPLPAVNSLDVISRMEKNFVLNLWTLLPVFCLIIPALFRIDCRLTMLASILAGCAISITIQGMSWESLFNCLLLGFPARENLELMRGGGLSSMLEVEGIILFSSGMGGILAGTDLLRGTETVLSHLAKRIGRFRTCVLVSLPAAAVACNQVLTVLITAQLCRPLFKKRIRNGHTVGKQRHPALRTHSLEHLGKRSVRHPRHRPRDSAIRLLHLSCSTYRCPA